MSAGHGRSVVIVVVEAQGATTRARALSNGLNPLHLKRTRALRRGWARLRLAQRGERAEQQRLGVR